MAVPKPSRDHPGAVATVHAALQAFAERAVFRAFSEGETSGARTTFKMLWHRDRNFELVLDARRKTLTFPCVLPQIKPRSSMDGEFRAWVAERQSSDLPEHRRIDPAKSALTCTNKKGDMSVTLTLNGNPDWDYGTRKIVSLVHEVYLSFLHDGRYYTYMIDTLRPRPRPHVRMVVEPRVTDRRRIGYLVSQYPGLSHTFVMREIRGLRELGWDVKVVSIRKPDRPIEALSPQEAEEFRMTFSVMGGGRTALVGIALKEFFKNPFHFIAGLIGAWRLAGFRPTLWAAYAFYFLEAISAGAWFRSQHVGHVHTHFSSTVALMMAGYFDIDYSVTIHGSGEFNDVIGFHMQQKVARAVTSVAISNYGASQIQRASSPEDWKKIVVVPLGVDLNQFAARPQPQSETFEIVLVGRIESQKAQHILIRAVRLLRDRGHKIHLTLVGDGPTRPLIENLVTELDLAKEVELAGAQNHDKVLDYYRRSNAFVCSSYAEGLPVVLMEAMAMEIPCVSTWITGIPELIREEVDGLLVPPASPEHIADAIERLIVEDGLAERIGKAGRARIEDKYNLSKNIPALAHAFERFVRR